jgi:hypothetical protein
MPEDIRTDAELDEDETLEIVHDDIVKRLLDYQRQLREGADEAPATQVVVLPDSTLEMSDDDVGFSDDASMSSSEEDRSPGDAASSMSVNVDADAVDATGGTSGADATASLSDDATPALSRLEEALATVEVEEIVSVAADEEDTIEDGVSAATPPMEVVEVEADVIDLASARNDADASSAMTNEASRDTASTITLDEPMSEREALIGRSAEVEARIERMELALDRLAGRFSELRTSFADMAIAADERIAEIEDLLADVRRRS